MLSFIAFDNFYQWWNLPITPNNLPLHLCHVAIILMVLLCLTRKKEIFYFCFFVNVFGALTACVNPDVKKFLIGAHGYHFWFEHVWVLVIPVTMMTLQLFERPKLKAFIASVGVYTIYYALVLILNSMWWDKGANYFFMNNEDIIDVCRKVFPKLIFGQFGAFFDELLMHPVYVTIFGHQFRFFKECNMAVDTLG